MDDLTPEQVEMIAQQLDLASDRELVFVDNGVLTNVHPKTACQGRNCWIHNPSAHPLANAPVVWDRSRRFAYRICPHNLAHEDPDDLFFRSLGRTHRASDANQPNPHQQLCDGCCGAIDSY